MISGLEYIHNKNILHRDIKPENIVLDEDGYLRVTDFGIARVWRPENAQDTSGTPGYMGKVLLINNFSPRSYVSLEPWSFSRLFCSRSDCF
jgi:serine/threonine protein kinase